MDDQLMVDIIFPTMSICEEKTYQEAVHYLIPVPRFFRGCNRVIILFNPSWKGR
jgi:hypothetical protein